MAKSKKMAAPTAENHLGLTDDKPTIQAEVLADVRKLQAKALKAKRNGKPMTEAAIDKAQTAILKKAKKTAAQVKAPAIKVKAATHPCLCGCRGAVKNPKSRFLMGHDSKLKSRLIHAAMAGDKAAEKEIGSLGWFEFLAKSRNNQKAKA